jgi:hypothetical protein
MRRMMTFSDRDFIFMILAQDEKFIDRKIAV